MDTETRTTIAAREAREFKNKLQRDFLFSQVFMLAVLLVMAHFDVATKWIVIIGVWSATGTLGYIIKECAIRFDAGRSYLEMWSNDAGTVLDRIDDRLRSIEPSASSWGA
jgi:hypothetical protein